MTGNPVGASRSEAIAVALMAIALLVSAIDPYDRSTWWLETAPAIIAGGVMLATRIRYPLTPLLQALIVLHALILIVGGYYSYARVPIGFTVADWFGWKRNDYDRLGHFAQGFVPALVAREILVRGAHVQGRRLLAFVVICIALAISASYELLEWASAVVLGQGADDFLGTQGDPWDTQTDMLMALIGAIVALVTLSRVHDCAIAALPAATS